MPPPEGGKVSPIRSEYAVTYRSGRTAWFLAEAVRRSAKRVGGPAARFELRLASQVGEDSEIGKDPLSPRPSISSSINSCGNGPTFTTSLPKLAVSVCVARLQALAATAANPDHQSRSSGDGQSSS